MIFIQEATGNHIEISTFSYGGNSTAKNRVLLDRFYQNLTFEHFANLFPDKLADSNQYRLTVAAFSYAPYCEITQVPTGTGNADYYRGPPGNKEIDFDGIDGKILNEFCHRRNCTLDIKSHGDENWGEIYSNGSSSGAISSVWYNKADFATCSYFNWYYKRLEPSQYAFRSAIRLLVPRPKRLPTSLTPIYPFSSEFWTALAIGLILIIIAYHCITMIALKKSPSTCIITSILDIFALYTEMSFPHRSNKVAYRLVLGMLLISGLMLSYSYTGELASVLTVPRFAKAIDTVKQFCESPYNWGNPSEAWVQSNRGTDLEEDEILVEKFRLINDTGLIYQKSLAGNFGIAVEELHNGEFSFGEYVQRDNLQKMHLMKEPIFESFIVSFARRSWPMLEKYNDFIRQATQVGLLDFWQMQASRKFLNSSLQVMLRQYEKRNNNNEEFVPLTVRHVVGPLFLVLIGGAVGIITFIAEIVFYRVQAAHRKRAKCMMRTFRKL
jgi:hypothetical protein